MTTTHSSTVIADCSDDEEYNKIGFTFGNHHWSPHPANVAELYEELSKKKVLELSWKCPGRRNPEQEQKAVAKPQKIVPVPKTSEPDKMDFDFEEESAPLLRRVPGKAIPSKAKKTSSLTGILANMERHRILDQMASVETPPSTGANS